MNRPIEFRAYHTVQKRMFSVFGIGKDFVTEDTLDGVDPGRNCFQGDEVNLLIIMQYTGLTDKNGKKIFEGDVCKTISADFGEETQQVIFKNGSFCFDYHGWSIHNWKQSNIEVIGTIHDHGKEGSDV